jgi:hypothetical protein
MTDRIALVLTLLIVAVIVADQTVLHWGMTVFLGQKFNDLVHYLAFWR